MDAHESFYTNAFIGAAAFHKISDATIQVNFVEQFAPLRMEDRILDLACGFGRHSLLLARKGYSVAGYDQSADYIEKARKDAAELGVDVSFERADMRTLDVCEKFDVVLSLQSSLTFYDDDISGDIFRRIHRAIRPGGTFVYDQANVFSFAAYAANAKPRSETLPDGSVHCHTISFDAARCVAMGRSVIEKGKERIEGGWHMRFYTAPELTRLAQDTGFQVTGCYGAFDASPYTVDSPRLLAIMKKR